MGRMRFLYFIPMLSVLSACELNGGAMPIDGQKLLSSFAGPKIETLQDSQKQAALDAEKKGNFALAAQIYQQMLEKDDKNNDTILALGDAVRRNGEYDKAISVYDNLLAKDSGNLAAKEGKALALLSKGDFETPTNLFEEVLKSDGKRWKSLIGIGILFVTRGLYPESQKYFEQALKYSPNNVSLLNNLGLSQALNKDFDKSILSLSKASAQASNGSLERKRVDLNLALVYATAGKLDDAQKIAEGYLSGPQLDNNLGLYAHLAKDDQLAKSYLNMALTDSKIYYEKAWENLESLNASSSNSATSDAKNTQKPTTGSLVKPEEKPTEKPAAKSTSKKSKK